ncbi:hypothetical protein [Agreia bicolorata]|uniref:Uncharacterized protein n=1 Tax=Agreia bicolorata TaxID=110935 RepID=A0ABR5CD13_9MICO|nr:hypothetical protein [Agreia bicolorata]KJC63524.1 hypothetical protein TZ00_13215 [Agreia bicolorata]
MQPGDRFPDDQAEVVFTDESIEWLIANVNASDREEVFDTIVGLFVSPAGKHRLSKKPATNLVGFNTVEACRRDYRIIYRAKTQKDVGTVEIITIGLRRDDEVCAEAHDLVHSGKLTPDEQTQIWDALQILGETKGRLGLEEWDYVEEAAPEGLVKAAVAADILDEEFARLLTKSELTVAMEAAWASGTLDRQAAMVAAMKRVASSATPERVFASRRDDRCGALLPLAKKTCIRKKGHAGAHRGHR